MSGWARALRFLNLFCAAILAGGLVMALVVLRPSLQKLPLSAAVRTHQIMMPRANLYMPPCAVVSALSAVALAAMRRQVSRRSAVFYRLGVACTATVGIATVFFTAPTDRNIAKWSVEVLATERSAQATLAEAALPPDHLEVWRWWDAVNAVRTVASLMALSLYVVANLEVQGREPAP